MNRKQLFCLFLTLVILITPIRAAAAITSTPTGYQSAEDVVYVIQNGTVVNWGARDEDATFLTTYAQEYYTGDLAYDTLSTLQGGTSTSDAYKSELYLALQDLMRSKHTKIQGYQDTRPYYCYTDCVSNDYSQVSSFYSGKLVNGTWNGQTYNREHIWPKSKCINTNKTNDSADIIMLRATISSENTSRGNSAYGESSGYFDPGADVRGDCARMVLYGYVRWGNTNKMWGKSGVMESMEVLLRWMEEDPVDTWEMGRNDAVQSITGVRNVFVDYPEYAWLIFGQELPSDMVTPSGAAKNAPTPCSHSNTQLKNAKESTCAAEGYTGDSYCTDCGKKLTSGTKIDKIAHTPGSNTTTPPTCTQAGNVSDTLCTVCQEIVEPGYSIPATGHADNNDDYRCDTCNEATGTPPTEPPVTEPTEPPVTKPTEPPATDPTEPTVTEPTRPSVTEPTTPATSEPTVPPASVPTKPAPTDPVPSLPGDVQEAPVSNFPWGVMLVVILCAAGLTIYLVVKRKH